MLTTGNRGSKDGAICWCPLLSIFERLFTAYLKIFLINVVLPWSMLSDYLLLSFTFSWASKIIGSSMTMSISELESEFESDIGFPNVKICPEIRF